MEKLGARLGGDSSGVSVEALDGAWLQLLDDADREEFIRLVNGHERLFSGLITQWRPWWRRQAWHRTVLEATEEDAEEEDEEEESSSYPCLYTQFERISKLTSVTRLNRILEISSTFSLFFETETTLTVHRPGHHQHRLCLLPPDSTLQRRDCLSPPSQGGRG